MLEIIFGFCCFGNGLIVGFLTGIAVGRQSMTMLTLDTQGKQKKKTAYCGNSNYSFEKSIKYKPGSRRFRLKIKHCTCWSSEITCLGKRERPVMEWEAGDGGLNDSRKQLWKLKIGLEVV